MKDLPPAPRDKKALFLSPEVYDQLRKAAEKVVVPDQKDFIVTRRGKETHFRLRPGFPTAAGGGENLQLPFEIYIGSEIPPGGTEPQVFIGARDGVFDLEVFSDIKEYLPYQATWYLQARIIINPDTGAVVSRQVKFVDTVGTNTASNFHAVLGSIEVDENDVPQESTIIQANYGPVFKILFGGPDEKWKAVIF